MPVAHLDAQPVEVPRRVDVLLHGFVLLPSFRALRDYTTLGPDRYDLKAELELFEVILEEAEEELADTVAVV